MVENLLNDAPEYRIINVSKFINHLKFSDLKITDQII
jgi:hypothetical protein